MNDFNQQFTLTEAATTNSNVYELHENARSVEVVMDVTAIGGTTPTLDVKVQHSDDAQTWVDGDVFSQVAATGKSRLNVAARYRHMRFVLVLAGTDPTASVRIHAEAKETEAVVDQLTVAEVAMTTANTEYSYAVPVGTKKIHFGARAANALRLYSTSGGSTYKTIPAGSTGFWIDVAEFRGLTLYVQSPDASVVLEVLAIK
jgi:uncharacterized protein YaiE (UPF0345 family)